MRPYISEILERGGKTYALPIPAKYRELLDCARTLGLKTEADEENMHRVCYKALYVPEPNKNDFYSYVRQTAEALSKLDENQVKAIAALCDAFGLPFGRVMDIVACVNYAKYKENRINGD